MQIVRADYPTTRVAVIPQMLQGASAESIGSGATLALRCTMCHGARGLSEANIPNLAGQYPVAIYKELVDFKTGARASAVMAAARDQSQRRGYARSRRVLRLSTARLRASSHNRRAAPDCHEWRANARDRALWGLSRRACQQTRRSVAGRTTLGLSTHSTRGLLVRCPTQRYRRADAQRRARNDAGGNRRCKPVLRVPPITRRKVVIGTMSPRIVGFTTQMSRSRRLSRTAGMGHEDQFRPPSLSGRCRLGQATFVGMGARGKMRRKRTSDLCRSCALVP